MVSKKLLMSQVELLRIKRHQVTVFLQRLEAAKRDLSITADQIATELGLDPSQGQWSLTKDGTEFVLLDNEEEKPS